MNPKLEDLRKKAFILYNGMDGVELVNKEIKRIGIKEEKLNQYQLKNLLNTIIKKIFIDHIGLEKTKEILAMDVTHLPGYHTVIEEDTTPIHIFERIHFAKWFILIMASILVLLTAYVYYYISSFDPMTVCDRKKITEERDSCFSLLAMKAGNTSVCDLVVNQQKRYTCISHIAVKIGKIDICETIPGDDSYGVTLHDRCISCIAYNLNNKSLCSSFMSPITQEECLMQIDRRQSLTC
jgi:hypothetical protein